MYYIIGLTGQTGAGKTLVSNILSQYNCVPIDCDKISKEIYLPNSQIVDKLTQRFGKDILLEDGSINRQELANRAFKTKEDTSDLNTITHPEIMRIALKRASDAKKSGHHAIIDAAALFESHGEVFCDFTIAVIAPKEERLQRIIKRDSLTIEEAKNRIKAQQTDEFYIKQADFIIRNYGDFELDEELRSVINKLGEDNAKSNNK